MTNRVQVYLEREICRRSFARYARHMWPVLEPSTPLEWTWVQQTVCDHLQALADGTVRNLLITIPPRCLKSSFSSVLFPTWLWLTKPELRLLTASYDKDLAIRDAVRSRRIMRSDEYRDLLMQPGWDFAGDQDVKSRYDNDRQGHRIAVSTGSAVLGHGGDYLCIDDPSHAELDQFDTRALKNTCDWYDQIFSTRANDPRTVRKLVVQQRLNADDLAGHLMRRKVDPFEVLCLPLLYEEDHPHTRATSLGFIDPRSQGESLMPERYTTEIVANIQESLGSFGFSSKYQQRPTALEGTIFKESWFKYWDSLPKFDSEILSADLNFGEGTPKQQIEKVKDRSYVVYQHWGFSGSNAYLIDEARGQWDFAESVRQFLAFCVRAPQAHRKLIEKKANGAALMSLLYKEIPGMIEVEPHGTKVQRAYAVQAYAETGNIYLPKDAMWLREWVDEVTNFPFLKRDDRVDALTQALTFGRETQHRSMTVTPLLQGNAWKV